MSWSEYDRYLVAVASYRVHHPEQRKGQAFFNVLAQEYLAIAESVWSETEPGGRDPFYSDDNLPAFLEYVHGRLTAP